MKPTKLEAGKWYRIKEGVKEKEKPVSCADRFDELEARVKALEEKVDYLVNQMRIDLAKGKIIQEKDLQENTPMIIGEFVRASCKAAGVDIKDPNHIGGADPSLYGPTQLWTGKEPESGKE